MLNKSGIVKTKYSAPTQILANVDLQYSVGCVVPESLGTLKNGRKIVKAGTPIKVNFQDLTEPAKMASPADPMNAVLLHDVDVINGNNNGTALIFGFINLLRIDQEVRELINLNSSQSTNKLITFLNL